jgi:hypothetical protein
MYSGLRKRLRFRSQINRFRSLNFRHVLEDPIRNRPSNRRPAVPPSRRPGDAYPDGNGESVDFALKGRVIRDLEGWLASLARLLASSRPDEWGDAVVFVATDDPRVVPKLRSLLFQQQQDLSTMSDSNSNSSSSHNGTRHRRMTVVALDQARPEEGSGVMFGEHGRALNRGERCLDG